MAKGFLAEVIPIAMTLFLFAFIFLIFFAYLSYSSNQRSTLLTSSAYKTASLHELLALLQTPVIIKEATQAMPIADAIVLAVENPEHKQRVHDEVKQYLSFFHLPWGTTLCGYFLSVQEKDNEIFSVHTIDFIAQPHIKIKFTVKPYVKESYAFFLHSYNVPGKTYSGELGVECEAAT